MYKVFANDTLIIITSSLKNENNFPVHPFQNFLIDEILDTLKNEAIQGINLYTSNLTKDWATFLSHNKVIVAAGGLVLNDKKKVLFIYRNNVWDLPKGKIEDGESIENAAIREVEEECGIYDLKIHRKLITTYHIYFHKEYILKESHWFLMHSNYQKKLIPQLEEGITKVAFKNDAEIENALQNTYTNIKLVYDTYKET